MNDNGVQGSQRLLFPWREALSNSAAIARTTAGGKLPPVGHTRWTGPHKVDGPTPHINQTHPALLKEKLFTAYHRAVAQEAVRDFVNSINVSVLLGSRKRGGTPRVFTSTSKNIKSRKCEMCYSLAHQ